MPGAILRPAEQGLQLVLDGNPVLEAQVCRGVELDEHVHVAVGSEVIAQHGLEERELSDLVTAAQLGDPSDIERDWWAHVTSLGSTALAAAVYIPRGL